ncbi:MULTISPECIES: Swt1 family HEPN domain-containing protein [unclassified Halomonas]|uniref:Swt1 family HEPN domain-containing protein n=1 Tax=unclassified Halomonas TaxID=2609666 RepID=UPI0007D9E803|nr:MULTISPECIES: Swt1 family HEPN domain-containing protein [unclassified Halomonas]MBT2786228.1 hypothetical protein [Halomonas sp. ISL-106]MBT2797250.1 hypothetical protein [Halomonas sp. ISL-104]OAL58626.1 hypothetical protein A6R74_06965 [Halomonas sp. ALS9]
MKTMERIQLFQMRNMLLESAIDDVEKELSLDLGRNVEVSIDKDPDFYPQFEQDLRNEAKVMSSHYEAFYCLERSIRRLITEKMRDYYDANWWTDKVKEDIQNNVNANIKRELDAGITPRSESPIDYTTFGELGDIVRKNWEAFDDLFNSQKAFNRIMTNLNIMRGPIAHSCPIHKSESIRLGLTIEDWFRLME